jgi:hypothetical protein
MWNALTYRLIYQLKIFLENEVERKGGNMQKHHKQLSDPWNQGHQEDLVDI